MLQKSELLLPAGSLVKLKTAILYGADAVYAGTPDMCLRAQSKMTMEDLKEGIEFVHAHGKKIYLTLNLFMHNRDVEKLPQFVATLRELKPDGVLIADPGVFQYVKDNAPELNLFVSTQANICSWQAVKFWQKQGAKLCVLGREVTYEEMKEIREKCPDILLECFMHGAMCMSYSGRCLISNYLADRSSNQGKCAHCCRWHYKLHLRLKDGNIKEIEINDQNKDAFEFLLEEEFRPGEYFEVMEDEHGGYMLNSKDMCLMPRLDDLLRIGIDSLKVEGRNKTEYYAGIVARAYRKAIDDYYNTSSISGIFKSFGDAPGGFKEELQEIRWSVGAEYVYNDKFSLRAGYHHESENKGNRKYFTFGAGFRMSAFSLDCGYVWATAKSNPLDQTLRFTLGFDMDGIKDLFRR